MYREPRERRRFFAVDFERFDFLADVDAAAFLPEVVCAPNVGASGAAVNSTRQRAKRKGKVESAGRVAAGCIVHRVAGVRVTESMLSSPRLGGRARRFRSGL